MPPRVNKKKRADEIDEDRYAKVEDLPEERRKAYDIILEDFDKQIAARIADNEMALQSLQNQVRSSFRIAKLQIQKTERSMIFEDMFRKECEPARLSMQLAAVKATVESAITNQVMGIESKPPPRSAVKRAAASAVKASAKKSTRKASTASTDSAASITAAVPATATRQSSRKRVPKASYAEYFETPLASKSRAAKTASALQTPAMTSVAGMPIITPKFNMATPLIRTVMRTAKPNEMLVSLSGSPVYAGATTAARARGKKAAAAETADLVSVPLGKGLTLMLPTSSPQTTDNGDANLDLDDDAKRRLMALRTQIDNMLQLRN